MTTCSPVVGFTANCTFEPPVSTPTRRMQAKAELRISWYSTSDNVIAGATVIESPVCTPIASMFSIEQMITQLSALSRMTSNSYSFQPLIDVSIKTSPMGLAAKPAVTIWVNSSVVLAIPVPRPPKMYAGRMMTGNAISASTSCASANVWAIPLCGTLSPISIIARLNFSRSSAVEIASALAPINSGVPGTPAKPRSNNAIAKLSAVWPPKVGNTASGRSRSMIAASTSTVSGSMYVRSAKSGSVMMVAGLEFARITR